MADALKLLLKAPSKTAVAEIFDACFRHRRDIDQVDCSEFAEEAEISDEEALELNRAVHDIIAQALYLNPLEESEYVHIFPKGEVDVKLKKLIAKIVRDRLKVWREVSANQTVSLPRLVDFDWRLDFKTASNSLSKMTQPSALLNLKIREQPRRLKEMPSIKAVDFEMDTETLEVVLSGLHKIRDQLGSMKA